jgi:uncharacterized protein YutE (UPF0331/DUF86 family)
VKKEFLQRLLNHLNFLEEELQDYPKFKGLKYQDYEEDRDKRRSVERWVENIINSSVDISKIILSMEGIRLPDNYKEVVKLISIVRDLGTMDAETLAEWVKFRSIVAHEYLDIRWDSIKRFIWETEPLYKNFLERVKEYLKKRLEIE